MLNPQPQSYCHIDAAWPAQLVVVIDTEEEFDWASDFSRSNTDVGAMRWIHRVQDIFDAYHIIPVYVVDYPVASQPTGYRPLQELHASGRALIGAHLHPWVNPPYTEPVNRRNSFPGNLPLALEAAKLQALSDCIGEHFGSRPVIYKAGRYGVGPHTAAILEEQGYEVDVSLCPHMDYAAEGGPEFSAQHYLALLVWPPAGAVGVAPHHRIYRVVARLGKHHVWASVAGPPRAAACGRDTVPAWSAQQGLAVT